MSKTLATLGASVLLCASQLAHAYLPGSVSGPFYNPAQSGHGINIDIVDDQRAIAIWHVYDTDGDPLTLYIDGNVEGRRIVGQAYAPEGMRFGEFNKEDLQLPYWGSVDIAFDDCDHATLSWVADDLAYGDGEMSIRRLVQPIGVSCTLPAANSIPAGLYESQHFQGLVDSSGVLWAIERQYQFDGLPAGITPSRFWVGTFAPMSLVAIPHSDTGQVIKPRLTLMRQWWIYAPSREEFTIEEGPYWYSSSENGYVFNFHYGDDFVAMTAESQHASLRSDITAEDLTGRYRVPIRDQFFTRDGSMEIGDDGAVCVEVIISSTGCYLVGNIHAADDESGVVEFRLTSTEDPTRPAYFGRGWIADTDYGRELVLVGHPDGGKGFGLVAIKQP